MIVGKADTNFYGAALLSLEAVTAFLYTLKFLALFSLLSSVQASSSVAYAKVSFPWARRGLKNFCFVSSIFPRTFGCVKIMSWFIWDGSLLSDAGAPMLTAWAWLLVDTSLTPTLLCAWLLVCYALDIFRSCLLFDPDLSWIISSLLLLGGSVYASLG